MLYVQQYLQVTLLWQLIAKTSPLFHLVTWEAFAIAVHQLSAYNLSLLAYGGRNTDIRKPLRY